MRRWSCGEKLPMCISDCIHLCRSVCRCVGGVCMHCWIYVFVLSMSGYKDYCKCSLNVARERKLSFGTYKYWL